MASLRKQFWLVSGLLVLWIGIGHHAVFGQCTPIVSGHRIQGNMLQGCAPFDLTVINLYANSTADAVFTVDWGDGNVDTYQGSDDPVDGGQNDPIYTPNFSHTYQANETDCGYFITIEVTNSCTEPEDARVELSVSVWDTDWRGLAVDPGLIRVCQGYATSAQFTDVSDWNCYPRNANQNNPPRYIQWEYNGGTMGGINIPGLGAIPAKGPVEGVMDPGEVSETINIPAEDPTNPGNPYPVGAYFDVTLNNWNKCNPPGTDPIQQTARVVIVATPKPDFATHKENASNPVQTIFCIDDIVYFQNKSTADAGASQSYKWEFYDGPNDSYQLLASKTDKNPVMTYTTGGQKFIRLTVADRNSIGGCSALVEKVIDVFPTSIAQINASQTKFCKDPGSTDVYSVNFQDASIGTTINTQWKWEFYDENDQLIRSEPASGWSNTQLGPFAEQYSKPGVYKVKLFTKDQATDCSTEDVVNIVIYNNPKPDFIFSKACEGATTELYDQSTLASINGSTIVKWEWDYDYDGTNFNVDQVYDTNIPDTVSHVFSGGSHQVALQVTNDQNGCSAMVVKPVDVSNNPIATFTQNKDNGCTPLEVTFTNTSLAGQTTAVKQYTWSIDYGSGFVDTVKQDPGVAGFNPAYTSIFINNTRKAKPVLVQLKTTSSEGCKAASIIDTVEVMPSLKPGFDYLNYDAFNSNCSPVEVTFQADAATRALSPTAYNWQVRNAEGVLYTENKSPSDPQFTYTFEADGISIKPYQVTFKANVDAACMEDSTLRVNVNPVPKSTFTIDTVSLDCENMVVEVDAAQKGLVAYDWTINEGLYVYLYDTLSDHFIYAMKRPNPGDGDKSLNIDLKTNNYALCESDQTSNNILVPESPDLVAQFNADPQIQEFPNTTVSIINTSRSDNGNYLWDFGDGQTSHDVSPGNHIYQQAGHYTVNLTLSQDFCVQTDSMQIYIKPTRPVADFAYAPGEGCVPLTVDFTNLTKYGDPSFYNYIWYFGDNQGTSTAINPSYTYHEPGTYSVKLEATSAEGLTDVVIKNSIIQVYPKPVASFSVRPDIVKLPDDPIYTTNLSVGANQYEWHFGDGGMSFEDEPSYVYLDTGYYDITLIATTSEGCLDTTTMEKIVQVVNGDKIRIPNAFTPSVDGPGDGNIYNSNGRNDIFYPVTEGVIAYKLQIFNRWGELLFQTEDRNFGWNGYYKGRICPQDVYVYRIHFKFIDGHEESKLGDVTLIR